jgi:monovalent cation:H+ antiporter-2, CPA2 family
MEQFDFLTDLVVVYATAAAVVFLFQRLRLPAIVGLLVAGVIVGPYGLSLVKEVSRVELLADIGVVLLLFTVGMEFTRERLSGMGHLLGIGALQVGLSILWTAAVALGLPLLSGSTLFLGFLVAHTSTTVMLKVLLDRGEGGSLHARIALAVSIMQDLSVVWMFVLIPLLAGEQAPWRALVGTLLQGAAAVALILGAARYLLPGLMFQVVRLRNRELFMSVIALICLGTAWLTAQAGLSLALGAFLAGVALAESEYSQQTLAEAIPFRDIFVSLFFISIGMLFDVQFLLTYPGEVLAIVAGVLVIKFFSGALPTLLFGYSWRVALLVGAGMAQIGEFAFVLSRPGREAGLLTEESYQALLAAAILTMSLAPFLLASSTALLRWGERWQGLNTWLKGWWPDELGMEAHAHRDHVIVVGYGVNGRNLARTLRRADLPYAVLDLSPLRVRQARLAGEAVVYGDCTRPEVLKQVGIQQAQLLVLAISDPSSARRAVQIARQLNPELQILVRTRYLDEVEELQVLGADEIIPEEFETSIEILSRVLHRYALPHDTIRRLVEEIREDHYGILRRIGLSPLEYDSNSEDSKAAPSQR